MTIIDTVAISAAVLVIICLLAISVVGTALLVKIMWKALRS